MPDAHLRVFRGSPGEEGHYDEFDVPVEEGMVVLDALHWIQGHEAPDLAVRWNCKAAKCGSCSAEVDGRPSLTCKTRLSDFDLDEPITVEPMRAFPLDPRPRDRCVVELRGQQDDPAVHAAGRRPAGGLALAAAGHRARPGIPQVHRVLPVPGRLPRPAQPRDRQAVHGPALPGPGRRPRDAPDGPGRPARVPQGQRRDRLLQHHQVLHRGLSRSTSRSPTTRSSRSRSGSPTSSTTRSSGSWRKIRGTDAESGAARRAAGAAGRAPGPAEPSADGGPSDPADDRVPG